MKTTYKYKLIFDPKIKILIKKYCNNKLVLLFFSIFKLKIYLRNPRYR